MTLLELLSELHKIYRKYGNLTVVSRNFKDLGDNDFLIEKDSLTVEEQTLVIE